MNMFTLLVEPKFPIRRNNNGKTYPPVSLLKLGAYYKSKDHKVELVQGKQQPRTQGVPNEIHITSLFTYWSEYVWDTVEYYRELYPSSKIVVGGVYVSLLWDTPQFKEKVRKYKVNYLVGLHEEAEKVLPDYSLLKKETKYHVMHLSRGCPRRCNFCGTWKIEPEVTFKTAEKALEEIKAVGKNHVLIYDNNLLTNPNILEFLKSVENLYINGHRVSFEAQSGFDGRLLSQKTANLLKKANFKNPRIAWDHGYSDHPKIKKQINYLVNAGFNKKDILVFMLYNFDISHEECMKKLKKCHEWGVQISDCRYRPLTQTYDNYSSNAHRKGQGSEDYYIHEKGGWSDEKIRSFRRSVREHNIGIRYSKTKVYNRAMDKRFTPLRFLFKQFEIGDKTPLLSELDKSQTLQKRVILMNIAYNSLSRKDKKVSFANKKYVDIDKFLDRYVTKNKLEFRIENPPTWIIPKW